MAKIASAKTVKVSVLVPIYNVEKFLVECLDSLVGQTLEEIEIICINDGSTDGSLEIVKKYAKNDKRVVVIDKKNTGYGDSMNRGLNVARGEYVGIVEPDDFVELTMFGKMYEQAKKFEVEVVKTNFYDYATKEKKDVKKSNLFLSDEVGRVVDTRQKQHIFFQQPSVWSAIYKAEFLKKNRIEFLPSGGASYQDAGFTFKVWATARRVVFLEEAFLHYRNDNPNSSVKSAGKVFAVKDEYDAVEKYLEERELMSEFGPTLAAVRMGGYIWNMRRLERGVAKEFAKTVEADSVRYKKLGYLEANNFEDKNALYIIKSVIVRKPRRYLKLRIMYDGWDKFKIWGHGLYEKIWKK